MALSEKVRRALAENAIGFAKTVMLATGDPRAGSFKFSIDVCFWYRFSIQLWRWKERRRGFEVTVKFFRQHFLPGKPLQCSIDAYFWKWHVYKSTVSRKVRAEDGS